jgi:hypothetical protein
MNMRIIFALVLMLGLVTGVEYAAKASSVNVSASTEMVALSVDQMKSINGGTQIGYSCTGTDSWTTTQCQGFFGPWCQSYNNHPICVVDPGRVCNNGAMVVVCYCYDGYKSAAVSCTN